MSKLVPLLFAGTGAAAISVGGVYLVKNGIKGDTSEGSPKGNDAAGGTAQNQPAALEADLGFKDLTGFQDNKGGSCAKRHFGENPDFKSSKGTAVDSNTNKISDDYFTSGEQNSSNPESCLVVNWERTNSTTEGNNKWTGGFRWLWSFKKGNKGFVMFVLAKPSSEASKLDLEGGIYFVEKASGADTWSIQKNKELGNKKVDKNTFENSLPKPSETIKNEIKGSGEATAKNHWGFVSGKDELDNVCASGSENCPTEAKPAEPTFREAWLWTFSSTADGTNKLTSWSSNFSSWANDLFTDTESNLNKALESFNGTWTKQASPA